MHPDIQTWQQELPHGITLSCRACGEKGRPVLMFLHGFPEAAWVWDALLIHFSKPENGGYRCVAPNLRGYERSSAPEDVKAYRAKYLVQDILALIQVASGPAPLAALVAHDWGGAVAWNLANQHPGQLDQLVIINSPHPGPLLKALQSHPAQQAASAYMNFLVQADAAAQLAANDFEGLFAFLTGQHVTPASPTDSLRAPPIRRGSRPKSKPNTAKSGNTACKAASITTALRRYARPPLKIRALWVCRSRQRRCALPCPRWCCGRKTTWLCCPA